MLEKIILDSDAAVKVITWCTEADDAMNWRRLCRCQGPWLVYRSRWYPTEEGDAALKVTTCCTEGH